MNEPIGCAMCGGNDHNADDCKRFAGERERFEAWAAKHNAGLREDDIDQPEDIRLDKLGGVYIWANTESAWLAWQARAAQPAPVVPEGSIYVECRQCDKCQHVGINDAAHGLAACHDCDWSGNEPEDDKCPGCKSENCMAAACPECGARYALIASEDVAAAPAQGQQVECQECERLARQVKHWKDLAVANRKVADEALAEIAASDQALRESRANDLTTMATLADVRAELAALKAQLDQAIIQREHWKKLAENRNSIVVTEVCPESRSVEEYIIDADSVRASWRLIREYRGQSEALRAENAALRAKQGERQEAVVYAVHAKGAQVDHHCPLVSPDMAADYLPGCATPLYTAPQPAPAQDVAGLVEALRLATNRLDRLWLDAGSLKEQHTIAGWVAEAREALADWEKTSCGN